MRDQLVYVLEGNGAHMTLEEAVADFPMAEINTKAPGVPYSLWHLLEHIRICQSDILEFTRNPEHISPEFPVGLWPAPDATTDEAGWQATLDAIRVDLAAMIALTRDESLDLTAELPHAPGLHLPARDSARRRPQCLSHRRIRDFTADAESMGNVGINAVNSRRQNPADIDESAAKQLDVLRRIDLILTEIEAGFWLRGGWAVDFLLGRISRPHADLDLVLWQRDRARVHQALESAGFERRCGNYRGKLTI